MKPLFCCSQPRTDEIRMQNEQNEEGVANATPSLPDGVHRYAER